MVRRNDLKRAFAEDGPRRTHIGGQALIEGVMMRGKLSWAAAVREPDGHIYSEEHDLGRNGARPKWFSWPLVRGCVALVDSLALGFKALEVSANHAFDDEDEPDDAPEDPARESAGAAMREDGHPSCGEEPRPFSWKDDFGRPDPVIEALGAQASLEVVHEEAGCFADDVGRESRDRANDVEDEPDDLANDAGREPDERAAGTEDAARDDADEGFFGTGEMAIALVLGIVMGVALFIFLPAFISNVVVGDYEAAPLAWNVVDGVVRIVIFVFYVWLIGRMKDIKRMFAYHGAEHKTIHCYEHGLELTPENARSFPCLHVRCGTAFLIMVMIVAIVVYTVVPMDLLLESWGIHGALAFAMLVVLRIVLMPLIAGVSYEITVKWAGSRPDNPLVRVVLWPGMQMQRLTTNEPDDGMLECAIEAMRLVIEREERAAREDGAADGSAPTLTSTSA